MIEYGDRCHTCNGHAPNPRKPTEHCPDCDGYSYILTPRPTDHDWPTRARAAGAYDEPEGRAEPGYNDRYTPCPTCEGGGWHPRDVQLAYEFRRNCPGCDGSGGG